MRALKRAGAVASLLAALVAGCGGHDCNLDATLAAKAGNVATDCGHVPVGGDSSSVDACVGAAFTSGTPFVARYDQQGVDSHVVSGLAGDSQGAVVFLLWDSAPCGGPGCSAVISEDICNGPSLNTSPTRNPAQMPPIMCTSVNNLGRICG
jgi:hypothetical protein